MFDKIIIIVASVVISSALTAEEGQMPEMTESPPQMEAPPPPPPPQAVETPQPQAERPAKEERPEPSKPPKDSPPPKAEDKKHEHKDRNHKKKNGYKHDRRSQFEFGLIFGLTEAHYYLPPVQRIEVIEKTVEVAPTISIFVGTAGEVETECLFPSDGFYTLLIPVDEAFESITKKAKEEQNLCETLQNYIVPEIVILSEIDDSESFTTLSGNTVEIKNKEGLFFVNGVEILQPYALKDKGVIIHILEADL